MEEQINLAKREVCTGCGACSAICPVNAINMIQSEEDGFFRPFLDREHCIQCGKCCLVCPKLREEEESKYFGRVYAANNKDEKVRNAAASGGLFGALAAGMLKRGGSVAGVVYDENLSVVYRLISGQEELGALLGSKYVQSYMGEIYQDIYEKLMQGKEVLFCGTPCQVMGIRRFLQEKKLEEKLVTVDLLCRGVPSPKAFHKYLEMIEKRVGKKVISVKFKDNEKGWHNIRTKITLEDGSVYSCPKEEDTYLRGFLIDNITVRESCFHCAYKSIWRQSDITIGDFWGLRNHVMEDDKGTSVVILNSEKGTALWEEIKQGLIFQESTMWRVIGGNRMAFEALPEGPSREKFWEYLEQEDYNSALEKAEQ